MTAFYSLTLELAHNYHFRLEKLETRNFIPITAELAHPRGGSQKEVTRQSQKSNSLEHYGGPGVTHTYWSRAKSIPWAEAPAAICLLRSGMGVSKGLAQTQNKAE